MLKKILFLNLWFYLIIALVLTVSVDWDKCFIQRGRYLLGIWYNGYFQNPLDGQVYKDYLKRHGKTPEEFQRSL